MTPKISFCIFVYILSIYLFAKNYVGTIFALFVYYVNKIGYTSHLSTNKQIKSQLCNTQVFLGTKKNCLIFSCAAHHTFSRKTNAKFSRSLSNIYISKINNRFVVKRIKLSSCNILRLLICKFVGMEFNAIKEPGAFNGMGLHRKMHQCTILWMPKRFSRQIRKIISTKY